MNLTVFTFKIKKNRVFLSNNAMETETSSLFLTVFTFKIKKNRVSFQIILWNQKPVQFSKIKTKSRFLIFLNLMGFAIN